MGCLNDILCGNRTIIGIRDFDACANPESRLFINEIPGITLKNASMVANEEIKTGYAELQRIIQLSTKLVFDDFAQAISPYFNFDAVVAARQLKNFDGTTSTSASNRGLIVKRYRSELAQIYIEDIYLKCGTTGNVVVQLIDGSQTFDYTISAVAGEIVSLRVDYKAKSESVRLVTSNVSVYGGTLSNTGSGCSTCSGRSASTNGLYINGWDGTNEVSRYYGIGVNASIRCYEENVLCSLLPRMYFLIWYKSGISFCNELIHSARLNHITTFGKEKAEKLRDELMQDYDEKYKVFVKSMRTYLMSTKNDCLTCNSNTYVQVLP